MNSIEANLKKHPALAQILTPNSRDFIWEICSTMNSIGEKSKRFLKLIF